MEVSKGYNKKVLIFSLAYVPFVGGAEIAVKEITDRIKGYEFDLVTKKFASGDSSFERIGNVNVYRIKSPKLLFPFLAYLKGKAMHKEKKYSVVWSIMANRAGYASLFFKRKFPDVKFLLTIQEGDSLDHPKKRAGIIWLFVGKMFSKIFTTADRTQVISNYLAGWAKSMGVDNSRISIVPNGVDVEKFDLSKRKKRNGENVVITTSRLVRKNGVDILIKAIAEINRSGNGLKVKCLILGSGPDDKSLKDLAKGLSVKDKVEFLGHIEPSLVPGYLSMADIFVRPSRSEGLGSSFLEAMAAGLPVIGTRVGGIVDFIKDPSEAGADMATGVFAESENPSSVADKIKMLLRNEELVESISRNSRWLVTKNYSWDVVAGKMEDIFSKICDNK